MNEIRSGKNVFFRLHVFMNKISHFSILTPGETAKQRTTIVLYPGKINDTHNLFHFIFYSQSRLWTTIFYVVCKPSA